MHLNTLTSSGPATVEGARLLLSGTSQKQSEARFQKPQESC